MEGMLPPSGTYSQEVAELRLNLNTLAAETMLILTTICCCPYSCMHSGQYDRLSKRPQALIPCAHMEQVGEKKVKAEGLIEPWHSSRLGWIIHQFPIVTWIWIIRSFSPSHYIAWNICFVCSTQCHLLELDLLIICEPQLPGEFKTYPDFSYC